MNSCMQITGFSYTQSGHFSGLHPTAVRAAHASSRAPPDARCSTHELLLGRLPAAAIGSYLYSVPQPLLSAAVEAHAVGVRIHLDCRQPPAVCSSFTMRLLSSFALLLLATTIVRVASDSPQTHRRSSLQSDSLTVAGVNLERRGVHRSTRSDVSGEISSGALGVASGDGVIQRQTYVFPSEYEAIDCGLTLAFSNGVVFGPVSVRLLREEGTSTTRCEVFMHSKISAIPEISSFFFFPVPTDSAIGRSTTISVAVLCVCNVRSEAVQAFCGQICTWQAASYTCEQPVSAGSSNTSLGWDASEAVYVASPPVLEYTFLPTQH
jgi:hypothetical protein